jgi:cell division septum initiation protein DivIVA
MPLATREEGDELLNLLAETVRQSLNTIEVQRQRFAKLRPVGKRND